ncbi:MAG TPA: citramalate synthase [Dehalococcoidia bacterium]
MEPTVQLYDTTLRDGAQMEGMSLSVQDKLMIAAKLDELGVHYIEGGFPGSNPKDAEFFIRASEHLHLQHATLVAFGGTRRADANVEKDPTILALAGARTSAVTLVGKASAFQVEHVLETSREENLAMISDSVRYFKERGKTVFFDAEHFFDGFYHDAQYALQCVRTAARAGADVVVLCDTNGGMIVPRLLRAIEAVKELGVPFGIHCHDDTGLAVANSLAAVEAGAVQVQGCVNGYGERCGNADLLTIIADLKLKMGIPCVTDEQLARLTEVSRFVSEVANLAPDPQAPYVGASAFAHKAGYHVAGMAKHQDAYQHVRPELVGNDSHIVVSELSGQRNIVTKLREQGMDLPLSRQEVRALLEKVKLMESRGYQYESAEASFELLVRRSRPDYQPPFVLEDFLVVERRRHTAANGEANEMLAEAMVKVKVGGEVKHTAAEGNGPVNALDTAVRKALLEFYPALEAIKLVDYKVRILDTASGTGASVRVLIESTDGEHRWRTVGSSTDIIEASWLALADALEYWLVRYNQP